MPVAHTLADLEPRLGLVLLASALGASCEPPEYWPPGQTGAPASTGNGLGDIPQVASPPPAPTASPSLPEVHEGLHSLAAKNSGKCLDVRTGGATGNALTFTCDQSATQFFRLSQTSPGVYRMANLQTETCLEVDQGSLLDGAKLKQSPCAMAVPEQGFRIEAHGGYLRLISEKSSKCIDVASSGTAEGTTVQQFTCNGTAAQDWLLSRSFVLKPHELRVVHSDKCLDAPAGVGPVSASQQLTCNGGPSQTFRIEARRRSVFAIVRNAGGHCLDVPGSSTMEGIRLQQWECNGSTAQFFRFQALGGGFDRIVNENSGKCLQAAMSSRDDGAGIEQATCTGEEHQRWVVVER